MAVWSVMNRQPRTATKKKKDPMSQRTWFITGISSGFGRQMTEKLLERGDQVAGTARKLEALNDLKARYGNQLWLASLDVTDTAAIRRVIGEAFAAFGRIDVIVNNPGSYVEKLATLTQIYLDLGLPLQDALRAAQADLWSRSVM
jgi:NADP-dependent 3-hydroxy acid dehydrogenase YdfG